MYTNRGVQMVIVKVNVMYIYFGVRAHSTLAVIS